MEVVQAIQQPPKYDQAYWQMQIAHSTKMLRTWKNEGVKIVNRFTGADQKSTDVSRDYQRVFRLNLFHRNIKTQMAIMYSQLPTVDVSRTQQDANDDVARVAGDMLERLLNLDVQNKAEDYDTVLKSVLQDRLLPGLGTARVRYEAEFQTNEVQMEVNGEIVMQEQESLAREDAPIEYYFWQDILWGWCRGWADMPWLAFRSFLDKQEAIDRFGEKTANQLTYKKQKFNQDEGTTDKEEEDSENKAEIWEIWCKKTGKVYWYSQGAPKILDEKEDPLGLRGFYPCPPFLIANATTTLYKPTPDFKLAQDLYNEVDILQTRISIITEAVKVVGVYDASADGIQRMLKEGFENDLVAVDNWALFAEKGGIQGQVDWMPIQEIASVLRELIAVRDQTMGLLQNITGMADVMQGALNNQYEGVGQSQIKAQFGSAVIQTLQEEFAQFVGDLFQIKAEIICKHYSPETIVRQSNMMYSLDQDSIPGAVQLLKDPQSAMLRVQVRPESIAMIDYAKLKQERTEFLTALATYMQSAAPLLQQAPQSMPFLIQMLQWTMAGFKGSNEIEGVLDKMAQQASQPQQQEEGPSEEEQRNQGEIQKIQAKGQMDMQIRQQDMEADIATENARHQNKMREIAANLQAKTAEVETKGRIDAFLQQLETEGNLTQTQQQQIGEIRKGWLEVEQAVNQMQAEAVTEIETEAAKADIHESRNTP